MTIDGERYEAQVPDTLDLAERAELALHALAGGLNPDQDYEAIGGGGSGGIKLAGKFAEAFPAMRIMSGSDYGLDVERGTLQSLVSCIGDDGLLYTPANTPARKAGERGYPPTDEDYTDPCANGRMMLAMMYHHQVDGDPAWLDRTRAMARGLAQMARYKDDYAYFPEGGIAAEFAYLKQSGYHDDSESDTEHVGPEGSIIDNVNHPVRALAQWYALSGDAEALALAGKITKWILKPKYWCDSGLLDVVGPERAHWNGHFHGHLIGFRSLLWYAQASGDQHLKQFVRAAYDHMRQFGLARIGWFPSWVGQREVPTGAETIDYTRRSEGCILGDIVALGVKLTEAGLGDYWDDVDGYVRNQLIEQQYTDPELIARGRERIAEIAPQSTYLQRDYLGGYCGGAGVTGIEDSCFYPSACCVPNGVLGLYYAWESIVRHDSGTAQVNLLLNRASPWLDVDSHLPYEGKVVITNKTAERIAVRIPGWVDKGAVEARVGDQAAPLAWVGQYLLFTDVGPGERVTIEFAMVEETVGYTVPDGVFVAKASAELDELPRTRYTCHFKGNTLVDITPRVTDTVYPLYRRDHYRGDKAPLKQVTRYVSPHHISW